MMQLCLCNCAHFCQDLLRLGVILYFVNPTCYLLIHLLLILSHSISYLRLPNYIPLSLSPIAFAPYYGLRIYLPVLHNFHAVADTRRSVFL